MLHDQIDATVEFPQRGTSLLSVTLNYLHAFETHFIYIDNIRAISEQLTNLYPKPNHF